MHTHSLVLAKSYWYSSVPKPARPHALPLYIPVLLLKHECVVNRRTVKLKHALRRKLLDWSTDLNKSVNSISDIMPMLPVDLRREIILSTQLAVIDMVPMLQVV